MPVIVVTRPRLKAPALLDEFFTAPSPRPSRPKSQTATSVWTRCRHLTADDKVAELTHPSDANRLACSRHRSSLLKVGAESTAQPAAAYGAALRQAEPM